MSRKKYKKKSIKSNDSKPTSKGYVDGVRSIYNDLGNTRSADANNTITSEIRLNTNQMNGIYKSGIGSKILKLKIGNALKETIQFEDEKQEEIYNVRLKYSIKSASKYMMAFGRSIIVLYERGEDLSQPRLKKFNIATTELKVFSGDMVSVTDYSLDLMDKRYYKPKHYIIRGCDVHYSRVIDFSYYEPIELDRPVYNFGGISEFELIYKQLLHDSIVERCASTIIEKNATLFYKVEGLKSAMQVGDEDWIKQYFRELENARSIFGAGLLDAKDEAFVVNQSLTNLADVDTITLRRIAMVTGIPLAILVGENVKGLNSSGDNELKIFQDTIENLQEDYLLKPINELMEKLDLEPISFKENQGRTPENRIEFESKAIENANKLYNIGEDHSKYLEEYDITIKDELANSFFPDEEDPEEDPEDEIK